jgi:hypothetical protein
MATGSAGTQNCQSSTMCLKKAARAEKANLNSSTPPAPPKTGGIESYISQDSYLCAHTVSQCQMPTVYSIFD